VAGRRWLVTLLAGAAVALLLARITAGIYTDYLWYASLGAADVWRARLMSLLALRLLCGVVSTLFVFANFYAVRQSVVSLVLPRRIGNLDIGEEVPRRQLTWTAAVLSTLLGAFLAWTQQDWSGYLLSRVGMSFGESDPYFATDLGFFVYRLPFELSLFTWTLTTVLIVIGIVVALYALTPSLRWEQGSLYVSGYVRRHLAMLSGVLLLVLAWHYRIEMYHLLGNGSSTDSAFTYIDHRVGIPADLVMSLVTLGSGITVLWAGWTGQLRLAFAALSAVLGAALIANQIAPFVARHSVDSDATIRERPYEATRAGYTRRAFAVDRIVMDDPALRFASLSDAVAFVPVWEDAALRRAADRPLSGTLVGWSLSDSGLVAQLPIASGGGSVAAYAPYRAEDNGAPYRVLHADAHPEAADARIVADSNVRTLVVADSNDHIAAPSLETPLSRIAHALSLQDVRVWLGALPSPSPKLVTRRSVRARLNALAPFFAQGSDVSPIWFADSLVWVVHLYSSSNTYPLSQHIFVGGAKRSYFQHAATALVNAVTGRTVLVSDSLPDPIASTWLTRFPHLFVRPGSLPSALRRQFPPARDGAMAQAIAFGRYGTRVASDAVGQPPDETGADSALAGTPQPLLGFPRAFATGLVLPLVDNAERLRGVLVATGGTSPRSTYLTFGPDAPSWTDALDRLRETDTVTASLLVHGFVRPVPVGNGVVLLQPRFDWRGEVSPRLLFVAALSGDSVRAAPSLSQLAGRLPEPTASATVDFRARVAELYREMRRALARGDWPAYGHAFEALGQLLSPRPR
jgi:uncharacterized protein